ncbi:MAG: Fe-S cluster assembly ATPase SufC [Patescibacteria group bacterium]|nr:Fe-S cluster assembly ATPase SufC [Patescibacteria group bacterium]
MLKIRNLEVNREGKRILKGVTLRIKSGETHILMGPNGSGKSTLANTLMGNPLYKVVGGEMSFEGKSLLNLSPDKRAKLGLFLAFQYPVEISGVSMASFLRTAYKELGKPLGFFNKNLEGSLKFLNIDKGFMQRYLNEGFSGGEKKKSEILQLAMFSPKLAILDETDSGLDVSALKTVAESFTKIKIKNPKLSFLIITHYTRILKYLDVDFVHIMLNGRVVKSGGIELSEEVEEKGGYGE